MTTAMTYHLACSQRASEATKTSNLFVIHFGAKKLIILVFVLAIELPSFVVPEEFGPSKH